jgi:hypothetical protein
MNEYVKWSGLGFVFSDSCPAGWLGVWDAIQAELGAAPASKCSGKQVNMDVGVLEKGLLLTLPYLGGHLTV